LGTGAGVWTEIATDPLGKSLTGCPGTSHEFLI
jgi:hypothetical protein